MSTPLIELRNVSLTLGKNKIHELLNCSFNAKEVITILGASGTGKTLLLKLIIGLIFPTSGEILLYGKATAKYSLEELRRIRVTIGMLFQGAALFDSLSVYENVAYSLREFKETNEEKIRAIVFEKLSLVGLADLHDRYPSQISGGQKKRIGLARALASSPQVMLFDEPTTGLDPTSRNMIDNLIIQLRDIHGITSIIVTHDIESARRVSDRLLLIANKSILVDGRAEDLWDKDTLITSFSEGTWK